jgi:hypothetical protein
LQDSIGFIDPQYPQYFLTAKDIQFVTKDIGWVVGGIFGDQLLAKTTNGGEEWTLIIIDDFLITSVREIKMLNEKVGWYVGSFNGYGRLMKTTDGGETWENQTPLELIPPSFESISMINDSTGWAVGWDGIYKTTNGGVTSVKEQNTVINKYWLAQNYPNPFNPTTTIKYNLAKSEFVKIKIINLVGEEVKTIENGFQSAGEHTLIFNAEDLSSGIYFYQLVSENYIQTKKLLLLK